MRPIYRERSGVSPVIATILLVAITIVLVGILFMWVTSIVPTTGKNAPDMNVALSTETDGEETYFKILVTDIDDEPTLNNIQYTVYGANGDEIETATADSEAYGNLAHLAVKNDELLGVGFADNDADGRLGVGDYFYVKQHFRKIWSDSIDISGGGMRLVFTPTNEQITDIQFTI